MSGNLRVVFSRNKVNVYQDGGLKAPLSYEFDSLELKFDEGVPLIKSLQLGDKSEDEAEKAEGAGVGKKKDLSPEEFRKLLLEEPEEPKQKSAADYVEEVYLMARTVLTAPQIARVITKVTDYEPGEKSSSDHKSLVASVRSTLSRYEVNEREDGRFIQIDRKHWVLVDLVDELLAKGVLAREGNKLVMREAEASGGAD